MDKSSSPLAEFTFDCLEECKDSKIKKEVMFEFYTEWAKLKNKSRETKERLGRNLPRYCKFILDGRQGKIRYWNNVKFKENGDIYDTISNNMGGMGLLYIYNPGLYIFSKEVSQVSQEKKLDKKKNEQIDPSNSEKSGVSFPDD